MALKRDDVIHLDWQDGKVSNANWRERMGLALLRLAAVATRSPERPGFSKIAGVVTALLPSERFVRVHFPDSVYQFPYGDAYWSVLCAPGFTYEKEIEGFVRQCAAEKLDYVFVDCGANFGYWSCRISAPAAGGHRTIAIEASSESFAHAVRNRSLNDNRFEAHRRAVSPTHDVDVVIDAAVKHEQRSIKPAEEAADEEEGTEYAERVRSLSLDRLTGIDFARDNVVLKLDIEGLEVPALKSGREWLENRTLIIFEDHGSDREHTTAKAFEREFGLQIYAGSPEGQFTQIVSWDQMSEIKAVSRKGYDFFATKSAFWLDFLARNSA